MDGWKGDVEEVTTKMHRRENTDDFNLQANGKSNTTQHNSRPKELLRLREREEESEVETQTLVRV